MIARQQGKRKTQTMRNGDSHDEKPNLNRLRGAFFATVALGFTAAGRLSSFPVRETWQSRRAQRHLAWNGESTALNATTGSLARYTTARFAALALRPGL